MGTVSRVLCVALGLLVFAPASALASGGGASAVARTVDVTKLHGLSRWVGNLYNDHRLLYALLSVGIVMAFGLLFGILVEAVLSKLGYGTTSMEHVE